MKKLFKNLTFQFVLIPLLKIGFKLEVRKLKRIRKSKNLIYRCISLKIRNIQELNKRGIDHEADDILFFLISDLLELKHSEEDLVKETNYKDRIESWKSEIVKHEEIILLQDAYFRLFNLESKMLKSNECKTTLSKNPVFPEPSFSNLRKLNKYVTEIYKNEYSDFLDRTTITFKLTYSEITGFLAVITPLIFIGSYLNTKVYYLSFGINTTDYFTITDYLSSSVADSEMAIYSFLFAILGIVIRVAVDFSVTTTEQKKVNNKVQRWMGIFVLVFFLSIIMVEYYKNDFINYYDIGLLLILLAFDLLSKVSARYFEKPLKALFLIFFSSFFLIFMVSQALNDSQRVRKINDNNVNLIIEEDLSTRIPNEYVVLGSNSNYFFISDTAFVETQVINKGSIDMVEITVD